MRRFGEEIGFGASWDGRGYTGHHVEDSNNEKDGHSADVSWPACFPRLSGACNVPRYHGHGGKDRCYTWA